jgi:hypothetical protein
MKNICVGAVFAAFIGLASTAFATECTRPTAPDVPNGDVASRDEMIAANRAIKEYVAATNTYIDCVDSEETAAIAKETPKDPNVKPDAAKLGKIHAEYVTLHNSAVDAIQSVADQFNSAVRTYKIKNPPAAPAAAPAPEQK